MEIIINQTAEEASVKAARVIALQVKEKPDSILGLATGSTPIRMYQELIRMHKEEGLCFSKVTTFNLDEYVGLPKTHDQSYYYFMQEQLFKHINVAPGNIHLPDGVARDIPRHCAEYEERIKDLGGIDIQVLGIGSDGHIAFNEPSSSLSSRTRIKTLTEQTVADNARFFEGDESQVPTHCITMGIGTIMEARMNLLLAFGEGKAEAIRDTVEGPVCAMVPASMLQHHQVAKVFIDEAASAKLKLREYYKWVYAGKPEWQRDK
jgi:glucosamine-6-phosphate deaminase